MSSELQVRTIELTPAVVDFNFKELSKILDKQLKKYDGLEFTEEQVTECSKLITELNKGKKSLNDYRLKTKEELSVSINEFEKQCKELATKFDSVINPLKSQSDKFEEKRKSEKSIEIQKLIDAAVESENLSDEYAYKLTIDKKWLNKSTSINSITEAINLLAKSLGSEQDQEETNIKFITQKVELINAKNGCQLLPESYIRLLEYKSLSDIESAIDEDGVVIEVVEEETQEHETESIIEEDEPFDYVYKVTGTDSQFDKLETYMKELGIEFVSENA